MSESTELNQEKTAQLKNFLNLLADLSIIQPPEQTSKESSQQEQLDSNDCDFKKQLQNGLDSEVSDLYDTSFIDSNNEEFSVGQDKFTKVENQFSNTIYLEASLISESDIGEVIDVESSVLEQKSKNPNPVNTDNSTEVNTAFQKLQDILVGDELALIQQDLQKINHQLYDSDELLELLLPHITKLLQLKIGESKEEIVEIITPIVDGAIYHRVEQDKESMGEAFAPAIPVAITKQISINSDEFSEAIAPAMGEAIKKQVEIESDKIVDALYPIIGNTIAKYMGETIQAINEQIENTVSFEGIKRKIQARIQGVSEAELIVKESISFTPQAIFLIHKASGLIISDIQPDDSERLESDMIAGMLTAIRSFASDCMIQSGNVSELDEIDYGNFKIVLEVAGYCYLAIIVKGKTPLEFISQMRSTLSKIIKSYGKSIETFEGDLETIPEEVNTVLRALQDFKHSKEQEKKQIPPLLILGLSILGLIFVPLGFWQYHATRVRTIEDKTTLALFSSPELSVYRLEVKLNGDKLKLKGRVPNLYLKSKAKEIATKTFPKLKIDNQIITVEVPASPVLAKAETERVTAIFNQEKNTAIITNFDNGKVTIVGSVINVENIKKIVQAFEVIPGIKTVSSAIEVKPLSIPVRFYFKRQSADLLTQDLKNKVVEVEKFLNRYPSKNIKIIGYSYSNNESFATKDLAIKRAKSVQQALVNLGYSPSRMQIEGRYGLPPGVDKSQPSWLIRCVILEPIDRD